MALPKTSLIQGKTDFHDSGTNKKSFHKIQARKTRVFVARFGWKMCHRMPPKSVSGVIFSMDVGYFVIPVLCGPRLLKVVKSYALRGRQSLPLRRISLTCLSHCVWFCPLVAKKSPIFINISFFQRGVDLRLLIIKVMRRRTRYMPLIVPNNKVMLVHSGMTVTYK